ncbi:MAG TPA: porphobilinogen synthase [Candidatus Wallbacteria bacterium]|nr:porphobilinogen synthase [Candidatus Wallbacteria bacterium]
MFYPTTRLRRLRSSAITREMIAETSLSINNFVMPYFVIFGEGKKNPVSSMPGVFQYSIDKLIPEIKDAAEAGIRSVLLFGIPESKDEVGSSAYQKNGTIQSAISAIKKEVPQMYVITDVCLCEYTSHGHCGLILNSAVDNDRTLEQLAEMALSHARAGADMVAPSDMMDGRVGMIREALDAEGFTNIPIMAYSAKYSSAFYGPFREAAESAPKFGDRKTYQMDYRNVAEALREAAQDIEEGADIIMVKPALSYLDVISRVKADSKMPMCAYNVSGEYSMVKAAAANGWIDEKKIVGEILTSIKRAGADIIISYHAKDMAQWLKKGEITL